MKSAFLPAMGFIVITASWPSLPSFDWQAALVVGAVVFAATALVIVVAVATPFIAIEMGATILGTCLTIGGIALATGIAGAIASGFYWGRQGDIKREEQIEHIKQVSNQLDIYFEPSDDPKRAADFQCTLVIYEETDLQARQPTVTTKKMKIKEEDSQEFYAQIKRKMNEWFTQRVAGDEDGQPRRVVIYMNPYPGEGVYDRLRRLAEDNGIRECQVTRCEGTWTSALPR